MVCMTIDPGKRKTGIFIFDTRLVYFDFIDNRKLKTEKEIYNNTKEKLASIIKSFEVDLIFLEDYPFGIPASRQLYTSEIKGIIKSTIYENKKDIKLFMLPIQTWKKYTPKEILKARDKSDKEYLKIVAEKYHWKFKVIDIADAFFMMICINMIRKGVILTDSARKISEQLKELQGDRNDN